MPGQAVVAEKDRSVNYGLVYRIVFLSQARLFHVLQEDHTWLQCMPSYDKSFKLPSCSSGIYALSPCCWEASFELSPEVIRIRCPGFLWFFSATLLQFTCQEMQ